MSNCGDDEEDPLEMSEDDAEALDRWVAAVNLALAFGAFPRRLPSRREP